VSGRDAGAFSGLSIADEDGEGRKEITMNGLGIYSPFLALELANSRVAELRREADKEHLAANRRRVNRLHEIAAAISGLTGRLPAIDGNDTLTPTLADYPYRA
jgi:hypothetical protein